MIAVRTWNFFQDSQIVNESVTESVLFKFMEEEYGSVFMSMSDLLSMCMATFFW